MDVLGGDAALECSSDVAQVRPETQMIESSLGARWVCGPHW